MSLLKLEIILGIIMKPNFRLLDFQIGLSNSNKFSAVQGYPMIINLVKLYIILNSNSICKIDIISMVTFYLFPNYNYRNMLSELVVKSCTVLRTFLKFVQKYWLLKYSNFFSIQFIDFSLEVYRNVLIYSNSNQNCEIKY